jgi:hypothetical protein
MSSKGSPTRGYLRRTRDHECAAHLKPASSRGKYECRICGSIHAPEWWGGPPENGGGSR